MKYIKSLLALTLTALLGTSAWAGDVTGDIELCVGDKLEVCEYHGKQYKSSVTASSTGYDEFVTATGADLQTKGVFCTIVAKKPGKDVSVTFTVCQSTGSSPHTLKFNITVKQERTLTTSGTGRTCSVNAWASNDEKGLATWTVGNSSDCVTTSKGSESEMSATLSLTGVKATTSPVDITFDNLDTNGSGSKYTYKVSVTSGTVSESFKLEPNGGTTKRTLTGTSSSDSWTVEKSGNTSCVDVSPTSYTGKTFELTFTSQGAASADPATVTVYKNGEKFATYTVTVADKSAAEKMEELLKDKVVNGTLTRTSDEQAVLVTFTDANDSVAKSLTIPENYTATARLLVVGGGGSGGSVASAKTAGGGGGAGEMVDRSGVPLAAGNYTITVGAGGSAGSGDAVGNDGKSSSVKLGGTSIITAKGGGGGGYSTKAGKDGGSGGGGGGGSSSGSSGGSVGRDSENGTDVSYVKKGGDGAKRCGGGGGGAVGPGTDASATTSSYITTYTAGAGGDGKVCDITGDTYAAGGGGGLGYSSGSVGTGGSSDIGGKGASPSSNAVNGRDNTGSGGGGGGCYESNVGAAGAGGSGIVIIKITALTRLVEPVDVPEGKSLEYSGLEQVGVSENVGYAITGTAKATNVGDYSATLTLNDGYVWSDESTGAKTVTWHITPATVTVTAADDEVERGKVVSGFSVSYSGWKNGESEATAAGFVSASPLCTTTYNPSTAQVGEMYPIVPGTPTADNYTFTPVNGTLTVIKPAKEDVVLTDVNSSSGVNGKGIDDETQRPVVQLSNAPFTFDAAAVNSEVEVTGASAFVVADGYSLTAAELSKFTLNNVSGAALAAALLGENGTLTGGGFVIAAADPLSVQLTGGTLAYAASTTISVPGGLSLTADVTVNVAAGQTVTVSAETAVTCGDYKLVKQGDGLLDFAGETVSVSGTSVTAPVTSEGTNLNIQVSFTPAATVEPARTATVEYSQDGETWTTTAPTVYTVGTHTFSYRVMVAGVQKKSGTATVTITQLTPDPQAISVEMNDPVTVDCTSPLNDTWTVTSSSSDVEAVFTTASEGTKTVTVQITGKAINAAARTVTVSCPSATYIYNVTVTKATRSRTVSADGNWSDAAWTKSMTGGQPWTDGADAVLTVSGDVRLDVDRATTAGKLTISGTGNLTLGNYQNLTLTESAVDISGLTGTVTYEYVSNSALKDVPEAVINEMKARTDGEDDQKVKYAFRGTTEENGWNFGKRDGQIWKTHIIVDEGRHAWSQSNNGTDKFGQMGTDENPTLLVKNGAVLNFTGRDLSGYQNDFLAGGVIRVNAGGELNFANTSYNMNYRQRLYLEPGSLLTFNQGSYKFTLHGNASTAVEPEQANVYVPASAADAAEKTATIRYSANDNSLPGLTLNSTGDSRGGGCAVFVGENSKLLLDTKVSKGSGSGTEGRCLTKIGPGELEVRGEVTSDVTFAAMKGIITLPSSSGSFNGPFTATADVTYRFPANWNENAAYTLGSGTVSGTAPTAPGVVYVGDKRYSKATLTYNNSGKTVAYALDRTDINVIAESKTIGYGDADVPLTWRFEPEVTGFTAAVAREAGTDAGEYDITFTSFPEDTDDYHFIANPGVYAITQRVVTVTAEDKTVMIGFDPPPFTVTYAGWITGEDETTAKAFKAPTCTTNPTYVKETAKAGDTFAIVPSGASAKNYSFAYVNGTLTAKDKIPVELTAVDASSGVNKGMAEYSDDDYYALVKMAAGGVYSFDAATTHTRIEIQNAASFSVPAGTPLTAAELGKFTLNGVKGADLAAALLGTSGTFAGGTFRISFVEEALVVTLSGGTLAYTETTTVDIPGGIVLSGDVTVNVAADETVTFDAAIVCGNYKFVKAGDGLLDFTADELVVTGTEIQKQVSAEGHVPAVAVAFTSAATVDPERTATIEYQVGGTWTTEAPRFYEVGTHEVPYSVTVADVEKASGTARVTITALPDVTANVSMKVGGTETRICQSPRSETWTVTSSASSVASVTPSTATGTSVTLTIKGLKAGTATVTASCGSVKYIYTVTVRESMASSVEFGGYTIDYSDATVDKDTVPGELIIKFTDTTGGTLFLPEQAFARILVVGGGAGGVAAKSSSKNKYNGNGGNAGEVKESNPAELKAGTYAITVGEGGQSNKASTSTDFTGKNPGTYSEISGPSGFTSIKANARDAWPTQDDTVSGTKSSEGDEATDGTGAKGTAGDPTGISSDITGKTVTYGTGGKAPGSKESVTGDPGTNYGDGGGGSANGGDSGAGKQGIVVVRISGFVQAPTVKTAVTGTVTYGQTLTATDWAGAMQNAAGDTVVGTFSWKDKESSWKPTLADSGAYYDVTFTPSDTTYYRTTTVKAQLVVNKASLTVTADDQEKVAGNPVLALTYTTVGLVGSDTLTGVLAWDGDDTVGEHAGAIMQGTLDNPNYEITFTPGKMTVKEAVASYDGVNYETVSDAIDAATEQASTSPVTILTNTTEKIVIPEGSSVTIDTNGKETGGVENNGEMDIKIPDEMVELGSTNVEFTVEGSGTIHSITTTDTSKDVLYTKEGTTVRALVQTKESILAEVKPDGGQSLMNNVTKLRSFLLENKVEAYTEAHAKAEKIESSLNDTGENKLELWKDYALGITPTTPVKPVTKPTGDTATDGITLAMPEVKAAEDNQSGDYTITYQVVEGGTTKTESSDAGSIKVPLTTGTYTIKAVFTPKGK